VVQRVFSCRLLPSVCCRANGRCFC
jgi:hypothetical protein